MKLKIGNGPRWALWNASVLLCSLLVLTACKPKQQQGPPPPPEVSVIKVSFEKVVLTTELPGRTSPFRIAEVRPQVNGLIQKRLFTEGSDVKEGEPLYQIDPAPFQAALDNAKAALARSEANIPAARLRVERYKKALTERAVSQQDYDDAAAALRQAEADAEFNKALIQTAQINLGYALVRSPISGRIGASSVTDGAIVTAYQPVALATIHQLNPIYVDVPQSATDSLRLQKKLEKGQISRDGRTFNEVELFLPDGSKYPAKGTLQFRDVQVDPTTGSVILRVIFPNPDKTLLPGMFVRAVIIEGENDNAILLPQQTVSRDPKGNPLALVVGEDNKVQQRTLTLDRAMGDKWLVSSGIKPGEQIIAEGSQKVRPGAEVRVVPFTESGSAGQGVATGGPHHSAGPAQAADAKTATK